MRAPWHGPHWQSGGVSRALSGSQKTRAGAEATRPPPRPGPAPEPLTAQPGPQAVVVAVQEPVQDPGEDGDVVIFRRPGGHLRQALRQRDTEVTALVTSPRDPEAGGRRGGSFRASTRPARAAPQGLLCTERPALSGVQAAAGHPPPDRAPRTRPSRFQEAIRVGAGAVSEPAATRGYAGRAPLLGGLLPTWKPRVLVLLVPPAGVGRGGVLEGLCTWRGETGFSGCSASLLGGDSALRASRQGDGNGGATIGAPPCGNRRRLVCPTRSGAPAPRGGEKAPRSDADKPRELPGGKGCHARTPPPGSQPLWTRQRPRLRVWPLGDAGRPKPAVGPPRSAPGPGPGHGAVSSREPARS